jgi:virulence-associated protein VapD
MAQYAIAFDLDTKAMRSAGYSNAQITGVYQNEIPTALAGCGFTAHPQGSLYHTEAEQNPINAIMQLQSSLQGNAPSFCQYVKRVHVFRMEEWSDVTCLIAQRQPDTSVPTGEEELDQQEVINS